MQIFGKYNNGGYNNQWIVVDMKRLIPGVRLEPGTLWILEQIPGYIESADVTGTLTFGYWPSYNVPYFPYIYNISGFPYYAEHFGTMFTYENNPRAEIFRNYADTVEDITDMEWMLRYNDYKHDALEHNNPAMAISSRFDLLSKTNHTNPIYTRAAFGGVDSKVTSYTTVNNMECYIQSGPSYVDCPPFEYDDDWTDQPHAGQPKRWEIPWVDVATGSLGQGLPIGVGVALAGKYLDKLPFRVWVILGDSEMAEGSVWEAFHLAAFYKEN